MKELRGRVAVVTGAASGIGRALAVELAREGCALAISDVDAAGLEETRVLAEAEGAAVHSALVDVAVREAVYAHADEVVAALGKVNLVVNNAGVGVESSVEETRYEDFEWLMGINFWGVVYGTKAFLPHLKRAGEGHIVNVSSVFGMIGIPGQSVYNAAKFAVRGFTESLRQELDIENCGVSATCVHPGGVKTNIVAGGRMARETDRAQATEEFERVARTTPERAARLIIAGVRANKRRVMIGLDARVLGALPRLLGASYQRLVAFGVDRRNRRRDS